MNSNGPSIMKDDWTATLSCDLPVVSHNLPPDGTTAKVNRSPSLMMSTCTLRTWRMDDGWVGKSKVLERPDPALQKVRMRCSLKVLMCRDFWFSLTSWKSWRKSCGASWESQSFRKCNVGMRGVRNACVSSAEPCRKNWWRRRARYNAL